MSAVAVLDRSILVSSRRLSEVDATTAISRAASSGTGVAAVIESIASLALKVNGIKRFQIEYGESIRGASKEILVWGSENDDGSVASAVAGISAGDRNWGELRLYFELQPSALESPLRFARFLAQQIAQQLGSWSLKLRGGELRGQIEQLRIIVEKRKAIQRARAITANTRQISDAEALQLMRQYSRESGRTLHQVAEALIFGDAQKWTSRQRYAERKRSARVLGGQATGYSA